MRDERRFDELKGRVAMITGASRGIGAEAARELARHGVSVLLIARTLDQIKALAREICDSGGQAEAFGCDVADALQMQAAVDRCQADFGRIDILVNNAGVIDPIARVAESDPEAWGRAVDINLKGVYHGIRAALPAMLAQRAGTIVNISSGAATGALEGWSHYCATKAGVLSLTRCVDVEYRAAGIRIIGLSPGTVATDMQVNIRASGINPVSLLDPSVHLPPRWPARAIAWLCTRAADDLRGTDFSIKTDEGRRRAGLIA